MVTALDKNTALVLIDLQNSIVGSQSPEVVKGVLDNAVKLINAFHERGLPVFIINVNPSQAKWMHTRKDVQRPPQPMPEDGTEIVQEIRSIADNIYITKHTWGAFFETELEEELKKRRVTGIVLSGISTSIGVEGTARQASERGFNLTFAKNAMMDSVPEAHENSLKYIFPRMGEVDDTGRIIEKLALRLE